MEFTWGHIRHLTAGQTSFSTPPPPPPLLCIDSFTVVYLEVNPPHPPPHPKKVVRFPNESTGLRRVYAPEAKTESVFRIVHESCSVGEDASGVNEQTAQTSCTFQGKVLKSELCTLLSLSAKSSLFIFAALSLSLRREHLS